MLYDRINTDDDIVLDQEDTIDYLTSERYLDAMTQDVKRKELDKFPKSKNISKVGLEPTSSSKDHCCSNH
jgi:hypothetical protein